jgi:DNA polymerase-1
VSVWLVVDANAVAHRAYHALGATLSIGKLATGMAYGFLRDITLLMEQNNTDKVVFCFDTSTSHRKKDYPNYKYRRLLDFQKLGEREKAAKLEMSRQIRELCDLDLPEAGFRNVFSCKGYEADDIIASVVRESLPPGDEAIIVSSDKDLYQLLDDNVMMWQLHKKQMLTRAGFVKQWGIEPGQWPLVKAIAGCETDDIEGVVGVAEKLAARYVAGELSETSAAFKNIRIHKGLWRANLPLVTLPYDLCPVFELREDEVSAGTWNVLCRKFGINSLQHAHPACRRRGLLR